MNRNGFVFWMVCAAVASLWLGVNTAQAQTPQPSDDDVNRVAKQLYCPVCENIPLDVCPTQACAQWRATIREKLVAGWDEQQIKDYFAVQYGERVLAEPPAEGFSLLVWLIPPIAVLVGAGVWWRFMRRAAKPAPATPVTVVPTADPYLAKVEEELKRRR
jgi:cytochrome c-type biogenesis protein CcmH